MAVYRLVRIPMKGTRNWARVRDLVDSFLQNYSNKVSICILKTDRKTKRRKSRRRTAWIWSLLRKSSGTHLVKSSRMRLKSMIKSRKYLMRLRIYV